VLFKIKTKASLGQHLGYLHHQRVWLAGKCQRQANRKASGNTTSQRPDGDSYTVNRCQKMACNTSERRAVCMISVLMAAMHIQQLPPLDQPTISSWELLYGRSGDGIGMYFVNKNNTFTVFIL